MLIISNAWSIIKQLFKSPFKDSVVTLRVSQPIIGMSERPSRTRQEPIASEFRMIFFTVLSLTILFLIIDVVLTLYWTAPTAHQQTLLDGMGDLWKAGAGAILGLLGGKGT
jgi:hypothetical protein